MKESQIQTEFSKVCDIPGVFELKLAKGPLPYSAVKEHQVEALLSAKHRKVFHKIADQTIGRNNTFGWTLKKPFDCLCVKTFPAYVAICYYKPRVPRELLLIDIDAFLFARDTDTRKSLTQDKAEKLAEYKIKL